MCTREMRITGEPWGAGVAERVRKRPKVAQVWRIIKVSKSEFNSLNCSDVKNFSLYS